MVACCPAPSLAADDSSPGQAAADKIHYHNAAPRSAAFVRRAVRAWNAAAAGVQLVPARREDAAVVIRPGPARSACSARAIIRGEGLRTAHARRTDVRIKYTLGQGAEVELGERCPSPPARAMAASHELGHVLGLDHQHRRCSVMSARGEVVNRSLARSPRCSPAAWRRLLRRLVAPTDVAAVRRLYRGDRAERPSGAVSAGENPSFLGPLGWAAVIMLGVVIAFGVTALVRR